jgi:hypothetical protein
LHQQLHSRSNNSEVAVKRHLLFFLTALTLLWSAKCIAAPGELGDNGGNNTNPHNLSSLSGNNAYKATSETQICIFCHTPHSATPQSTLWNRRDPTGMGSFPFRTGTLNIDNTGVMVNTTHYSAATSGTEGYPNGTSKLCLSCHDGVTAMGVLAYETIAMTGDGLMPAGINRIDLTKSHPISFIYNTTVEGYLDAIPPLNSYKMPAAGYLETDSAGVTRVQCTSCHQPHQDTKGTAGGIYPFWRYGGGLAGDYNPVCQECHLGSFAIPGGSTDHNYTP